MTVTARCHCGSTRIQLPAAPTEGTICNCTFCNRTGAVWAYYDQGEVTVVADHDQRYSASDGANDHRFCGRCGGNTHGYAPDYVSALREDGSYDETVEIDMSPKAKRLQVNLRMIDDFDAKDVRIVHLDGRNSW